MNKNFSFKDIAAAAAIGQRGGLQRANTGRLSFCGGGGTAPTAPCPMDGMALRRGESAGVPEH